MSDVLRVLTEAREVLLAYHGQQRLANDTAVIAVGNAVRKYKFDEGVKLLAWGVLDQQASLLWGLDGIFEVAECRGGDGTLRMFDAAIAAEQAKLASPSP